MKNLWENLDQIIGLLRGSPIKILMFDFDGTLSPIAKTPDGATLPPETKDLLQKLSQKKGVFVTIISGRRLTDLKTKIELPNIIYAGNHGLEAEIYDKEFFFPIKKAVLKTLSEINSRLKPVVDQFDGLFIEEKRLTLSLHFRKVEPGKIKNLKLSLDQILQPYKESGLFTMFLGKKILEILPTVEWDKGHFANLVIDEINKITKQPSIALFIGDDTTDEDVFNKLRNGITIQVGKSKKTKARYYLKNPQEVVKFLEQINQI